VHLPNPLSLAEHDHGHLSQKIAVLHAEVTALRAAGTPLEPMADDLVQALVALSDDLFEHFAHEEEALFPHIVAVAPDLAPAVASLVEGHDRICGAATRLLALRDRPPTAANVELAAALFQRLVDVYAEHSGREHEVLGVAALRLAAAGAGATGG
jgi:iron-sulfur cluster repair protein YtfE (RIC family)